MTDRTDDLIRDDSLPWNFVTDHLPDHAVPNTALPARIEFRTEGAA